MTRYKIQIEVVHCVSCSKFILWDRESEQLLGLSAAQMRNTVIEVLLSIFNKYLYIFHSIIYINHFTLFFRVGLMIHLSTP